MDYDPQKFGVFKIGTTTKSEIVQALGAPQSWTTDSDRNTTLFYAVNKKSKVLGMDASARLDVVYKFNASRILVEVRLP